jgi:hypothetical protein
LYAALVGKRPFAAASMEQLLGSIDAGPPALPADAGPTWLRRAVARGLSADPRQRHPSMNALVGELTDGPRRRQRVALGALGTAILTALVILAYRELSPGPDRVCRVATRQLGELWGEKQRARLEATRKGTPPLEWAAYSELDQRIQRWVRDWVRIRVGACEDAGSRDAALAHLFAQRMSCLDEQRRRFREVIDGLVDASPNAVHHAAADLAALGPPSSCVSAQISDAP